MRITRKLILSLASGCLFISCLKSPNVQLGPRPFENGPVITELRQYMGHSPFVGSLRYIEIRWTAVQGAIKYHTEVSTSPDSGFTRVTSGLETGTHRKNILLERSGTYYFRVSARNESGEVSPPSPARAIVYDFQTPGT